MALFSVEVVVEYFLSASRTQLLPSDSSGFSEGATETFYRLKSSFSVNMNLRQTISRCLLPCRGVLT
jgi:hypothetical protein